ncbi:MAG: InlB B-repeat-containing protein, partial [Eubacteriales bacterium]|nr:InlB B-repeat-containing protein [Eubacteriales bacterium]
TAVNPATMTIVAREVTIKIPDQSKKYDESGVTPDGELVNLATPTNKDPETASINAPTYTEAGVYPLTDEADAISVKWDGTAKAENYTVKKDLGTLTIYYEITFDANGGEDAPETLQVAATSTTMPSEKPTRSGYKFLGWAEDPDATTAKYKAGARTTLDNNLDLYAVWELDNPETDTNSNMSLLVMTVIFMVYVIEAVIYRRKRI